MGLTALQALIDEVSGVAVAYTAGVIIFSIVTLWLAFVYAASATSTSFRGPFLFLARFQSSAPTSHAPWGVLYAVPVLIGCR